MSSTIPALPAASIPAAPVPGVPEPPKAAAKPSTAQTPDPAPHPPEHRPAPTLTPADVGYVDSLLGFAPPQVMEYIMLKTGVPLPANLGQDIDTSV